MIATKVGPMLGPDDTPALQATPGQLRRLVEDNLRELGADHLDPAAISAWCGQRRAGGHARRVMWVDLVRRDRPA